MAFNTYQASSNSFPVTVGFVANDDYLIYNNTQCPLHVDVLPDSDGETFTLMPGGVHVYHHSGATVSSAVNVIGTPMHTAVYATTPVQLEQYNTGERRVNESQARLVVTGF